MMQHNLMPGDRVTYKGATGVVMMCGAERGTYYVLASFSHPTQFKKKFENNDIKNLKKI